MIYENSHSLMHSFALKHKAFVLGKAFKRKNPSSAVSYVSSRFIPLKSEKGKNCLFIDVCLRLNPFQQFTFDFFLGTCSRVTMINLKGLQERCGFIYVFVFSLTSLLF